MSNNKQSSVEFLWKQLKPLLPDMYSVDESVKILSILKQAKEMHKEEIIKAMSTAFIDGAKIGAIDYESPYENWEQYYNETFNTKEK